MRRYVVQNYYDGRRDGIRFGPWETGQVVELPESDAGWINRDCPGSLKDAPARPKVPARNRAAKPKNNRGV